MDMKSPNPKPVFEVFSGKVEKGIMKEEREFEMKEWKKKSINYIEAWMSFGVKYCLEDLEWFQQFLKNS